MLYLKLDNHLDDVPCDFPYNIQNPRYTGLPGSERYIPVPCGKCPGCCKRRSDGWQFRLLQQEKVSTSAYFITLTYSTDTVPINKSGYMTLQKRDFQLFMKRLRKLHPKEPKISYYACGEYGSLNERPHFHAIIFNIQPDLVNEAWGLGETKIGSVSGASVAYTTKYMNKGKLIPKHKNDDRVPEFSLMSKKLGVNYLTPSTLQYHQADLNRNYITLEDGVKIALPRYFREKIYTEDQREIQGKNIAALSLEADQKRRADFAQRTGNPDDYERAQFEAKKAALINFRKQSKDNRKI